MGGLADNRNVRLKTEECIELAMQSHAGNSMSLVACQYRKAHCAQGGTDAGDERDPSETAVAVAVQMSCPSNYEGVAAAR